MGLLKRTIAFAREKNVPISQQDEDIIQLAIFWILNEILSTQNAYFARNTESDFYFSDFQTTWVYVLPNNDS